MIEPLPPWINDEHGVKYMPRASGNVESSGKVGHMAKDDPERTDERADKFVLSKAAHEFNVKATHSK